MDSRSQIENLLAKYCRLYDDGNLDEYADLFQHGAISGMRSHNEIVNFHRSNIYFYDGEPRTRHVISNIEVEINEEAGTASGRCYLTCYQAAPGFPLQPIFVGSYIDQFRRVDGEWWFADRQFESHLMGDTSRHARPDTNLPRRSENPDVGTPG